MVKNFFYSVFLALAAGSMTAHPTLAAYSFYNTNGGQVAAACTKN